MSAVADRITKRFRLGRGLRLELRVQHGGVQAALVHAVPDSHDECIALTTCRRDQVWHARGAGLIFGSMSVVTQPDMCTAAIDWLADQGITVQEMG